MSDDGNDMDVVVHPSHPLSLETSLPCPPRDVVEKESGSKQWLNHTHRTAALLLGCWMVTVLLLVAVSNDRTNWIQVLDLQGREVAQYGWGSASVFDARLTLQSPVFGGGLVMAFVVWLGLTLYLTALLFRVYRNPLIDYDVQTKVKRWLRVAQVTALLTLTTLVLFLLHVSVHIASMGLALGLRYSVALCIGAFLEMQVMQFIDL